MGAAKKILIAEDEEGIRDQVSLILVSKGFETTVANDGAMAASEFDKNKFDLVISDVRMPNKDGLFLFSHCMPKGVPFIFMTGFAEALDLKGAYEIGAADFLAKPFGMNELLTAVELALHKSDSENSEMVDVNYCPIHIDEFLGTINATSNVFLRLTAGKYIQVVKAGGSIERERLLSYKAKGLQHLYVKKEDFAKYVGFTLKVASGLENTKKPIDDSIKLQLIQHTTKVYMQKLFLDGVDREALENAKNLTESMVKLAIANDDIFSLLEMLKKNSDSTFAHCLAVSVYSGMIAKAVG